MAAMPTISSTQPHFVFSIAMFSLVPMASDKFLPRIRALILVLCGLSPLIVQAQFHYIGAEAQVLAAPTKGSQVGLSIGWVWQVAAHHGFGLDMTLPFYLRADVGKSYASETETAYDAQLAWRRQMLPFPGIRYRLFVGDNFFVGTCFNVGLIKEQFSASRSYQPAVFGQSDAVSAVQVDQQIKSPFFRLQIESGLLWNIGSRMYGTLQARFGLQVTSPPLDPFATFALNSEGDLAYRPYHGKDLTATAIFGLGLKL
jgi:hypothetical protein